MIVSIADFIKTMNQVLKPEHIQFELVKTTAPSIGRLLFNNFDRTDEARTNCGCIICNNNVRGDDSVITSSVTKNSYRITSNIDCHNSGIYAITCKCVGQYAGKTTVGFNNRFPEHWNHKSSSVYKHLEHYKCTNNCNEIKMQFLENVWGRGKYSLSEREFLWNKRLKGVINIQKTLRNWIFLIVSCCLFCRNVRFIFDANFYFLFFSWRWPPRRLKHVLLNKHQKEQPNSDCCIRLIICLK